MTIGLIDHSLRRRCGPWCCAGSASTRHLEQTAGKIKALALNGLTMNGRKIIHALANVKMDGTRTSQHRISSAQLVKRGRKPMQSDLIYREDAKGYAYGAG